VSENKDLALCQLSYILLGRKVGLEPTTSRLIDDNLRINQPTLVIFFAFKPFSPEIISNDMISSFSGIKLPTIPV